MFSEIQRGEQMNMILADHQRVYDGGKSILFCPYLGDLDGAAISKNFAICYATFLVHPDPGNTSFLHVDHVLEGGYIQLNHMLEHSHPHTVVVAFRRLHQGDNPGSRDGNLVKFSTNCNSVWEIPIIDVEFTTWGHLQQFSATFDKHGMVIVWNDTTREMIGVFDLEMVFKKKD